MIESNFNNIINALSKYENLDGIILNNSRDVDEDFLHNNQELIRFYSQIKLNNFVIEMGSGLSLVDYDDLKKNSNYSFDSLASNEYIVFLEQVGGSEPILFNFSKSSSPTIYAAYDTLEAFKIADDFNQFADALVALINIVYGKYNIYDIYINDDSTEYDPNFFPDICTKLFPILKNNYDNFADYFWG